jgi:ABC-type lipoprotein release transport system permease subunit
MSVEQQNGHRSHAEIRKQIKLPFSKALEISLKSIKIRFARSIITAAGIMLGIAFFASVRMAAQFSDIEGHIVQQTVALFKEGKIIHPTDDQTRMINSANSNDTASKEDAVSAKERLNWLSIMALIVCTVGITNAMLMSVTERYKEIGTMKCLGALDSFIVKLFFIESCLVGFISSFIGFFVGWFVISLVHIFTDGIVAFGAQFWFGSLQLFGWSVFIGTFLTFIATIPPAVRAAQMPPAAALRVEI